MRARVAAAIAAGSAARVRRARLHRGLPRGLRDRALLPGAGDLRRGPRGSGSLLGAVAAALALGVVAYAILKLGRKLPLKPMLIAGAVDAAGAVGHLRRQRRAVAAGGRRDRASRRSPAAGPAAGLLAELTGIHPTQRGPADRAAGRCSADLLARRRATSSPWQPARRPAPRRQRGRAPRHVAARALARSASTSAGRSRRRSRSRPAPARAARQAVCPPRHDAPGRRDARASPTALRTLLERARARPPPSPARRLLDHAGDERAARGRRRAASA